MLAGKGINLIVYLEIIRPKPKGSRRIKNKIVPRFRRSASKTEKTSLSPTGISMELSQIRFDVLVIGTIRIVSKATDVRYMIKFLKKIFTFSKYFVRESDFIFIPQYAQKIILFFYSHKFFYDILTG